MDLDRLPRSGWNARMWPPFRSFHSMIEEFILCAAKYNCRSIRSNLTSAFDPLFDEYAAWSTMFEHLLANALPSTVGKEISLTSLTTRIPSA